MIIELLRPKALNKLTILVYGDSGSLLAQTGAKPEYHNQIIYSNNIQFERFIHV